MKVTFLPQGIAAMWLRAHAPNAEQDDILSLASLMEGIWADGVKAGLEHATGTMDRSPTMSAAKATLEADTDELKRKYATG